MAIQETAKIVFDAKTANAESKLEKFKGKAKAAALAVGAASAALVANSVRLFAIQDKAERQAAAAVKQLGANANVTTGYMKQLASDYQKVSIHGDEANLQVLTMGLRVGKLNKDHLPKFLDSAGDMAAVMGTDIKNASQVLSKALGDPIRGVTQLQRYGVILNDTQKETVKQLVATGDTAGAQAILLGELQKAFGGASEAAAEGTGKYIQISNRLGDMQEKIGKLALDVVGKFVPAFDRILNALENVGTMWDWAKLKAEQFVDETIWKYDELMLKSEVLYWKTREALNPFSDGYQDEIQTAEAALQQHLDTRLDKLQEYKDRENEILFGSGDTPEVKTGTGYATGGGDGGIVGGNGGGTSGETGESGGYSPNYYDSWDNANPWLTDGRTYEEIEQEEWERLEAERERHNERLQMHADRIQAQFAEAEAANRAAEEKKKLEKQGLLEAKKSAKQAIAIFAEKSSKIKAMHKAIRIAETIMNTAQGVMSAVRGAHDTYPPPVSTAVAAANSAVILGTGAAQLAQIKKMQAGGVVGGINRGIDSVPALLQPGEIVLPRTGESYADLRAGILRQAEADNYDREPAEISITIDQDGLGQFIRAELASERSLQGA